MGEIADAMIDGTLDYMTGEYIGEGYGCPRTRTRTTQYKPSRGIKLYLKKKQLGINVNDAVTMYNEHVLKLDTKDIKTICIEVNKNFHKFSSWICNKCKAD